MGNNFHVTNIHAQKQADTKIHTDTDTQTFIHKQMMIKMLIPPFSVIFLEKVIVNK